MAKKVAQTVNKIQERASIETFYDAIKWVIFGIFAIVYFGLRDAHFWWAMSFLVLFVVALHFINLKRERELERYR